jgi:hypothetical protein
LDGVLVGNTSLRLQFWTALDHCFLEGEYKTQDCLARAAGVSQATISLMKSRKRTYRPEIQAKVAKAFGYDLVDFLALGRWILQGGDPKTYHSPGIPKDKASFSAEELTWAQLELLGVFMQQHPDERYAVALEDREIYIGDRKKTSFIEGKRFLVRLDGKIQVRIASRMGDSKVLINKNGRVEQSPGPWPGDWVLGQVVFRGIPED